MSNNSSKLKADPDYYEVFKKVIHEICLVEKVSEIEKQYKKEYLSVNELKKLKKNILSKHTPHRPDILKNFTITTTEIPPGILCSKCNTLSLKLHHGKCHCIHCGDTSATAHLEAIKDYFLLISPNQKNSELKRFLRLENDKQAYWLLTSLGLPFTGNKRGRVYHEPPNWQANTQPHKVIKSSRNGKGQ